MARKLMDREMEACVDKIFNHEDSEWQAAEVGPELSDAESLEFMTQLFSFPDRYLAKYSDQQINQGFWFIIPSWESPFIDAIFSSRESWRDREACIFAISELFRTLFEPRCRQRLSSTDFSGKLNNSPLNSICYMFWDLMPGHGSDAKSPDPQVDAAFLEVMEGILELKNIACQESALHGLGHFHDDHPSLVADMIDRYLKSHPWLRDDLRQYAICAREGMVQ